MTSIENRQREQQAIQAIVDRNADALSELVGIGKPATYPMLEAALRIKNDESGILDILLETDDLDNPDKNSEIVAQVIRDGQPGKFIKLYDSGFNFWGFDYDEVDKDRFGNQQVNRAVMTAITRANDSTLGAPYRDLIRILMDLDLLTPDETLGGIDSYLKKYSEQPNFTQLKQMLE